MLEAAHWAGLGIAYLVGSTPFAYLAGRVFRGIDLRQHGSGNLGATNVYRSLGAPAAVLVLALDAAKGAVPAATFASVFGGADSAWWPAAYGVAAILGHVRPYAGWFKGGGKGVATTAGVFGAVSPLACAVAVGAFVVLTGVTRFVSVGSMVAAVVLGLVSAVAYGPGAPRTVLAVCMALFVLWTHRVNIGRLHRGEEPRLGAPQRAPS